LGPPKRVKKTACAPVWRIFSLNKSATANNDFHTSRPQKNFGIKGIFVLSGLGIKLLLKLKKHKAVDDQDRSLDISNLTRWWSFNIYFWHLCIF
jgi:hypothetical protein